MNEERNVEKELELMTDAEIEAQAKDVKYDNNRVVEMFVGLLEQEADRKEVALEKIAFCLFVKKRGISFRTRCRILSLDNPKSFVPEVVKVKEITDMDMLGHISKAIKLILKEEKDDYDRKTGVDNPFGLFQCYVQIINKELNLTMVFDRTPIRKFDLQKEFGNL